MDVSLPMDNLAALGPFGCPVTFHLPKGKSLAVFDTAFRPVWTGSVELSGSL
jgi:hypothetical protein